MTADAFTICVVSAGAAVTSPAQAVVDPDKSVFVFKDDSIVPAEGFGVGETVQVTFTVPETEGRYPFLCTFAGHYQAGMKGTLSVQSKTTTD